MTMRTNPPRLDNGYEDDLNYENIGYTPAWLVLLILGVGAFGITTKSLGWW